MLDIEDVAQQLGCTISGIRKLVVRGELRYFQHGKRGRLKFKPEWIDEFVTKHTVAPTDEQPQRVLARPRKNRSSDNDTGSVCGFIRIPS